MKNVVKHAFIAHIESFGTSKIPVREKLQVKRTNVYRPSKKLIMVESAEMLYTCASIAIAAGAVTQLPSTEKQFVVERRHRNYKVLPGIFPHYGNGMM